MSHRLLYAVLCLALWVTGGSAAVATETDDLYRSRTVVTGISDDTRIPAVPPCLLDVLVKVSGDARLLHDPRAKTVAAGGTLLAVEYSYRDRFAGRQIHDEQGTRDRPYYLTIAFNPQRVDAALQQMGSKPWLERPRLGMFVLVQNGPTLYVLAEDGEYGRDQRDSLAAVSWQIAMPVAVPDEAALAKAGLTVASFPTAGQEKFDQVAKAMGVDRILTGKLVWNKGTLGWAAEWRLFDGKAVHDWKIKDVSFDDAFRSALRGSAQILSGNGEP
jgi:hypothetical protein